MPEAPTFWILEIKIKRDGQTVSHSILGLDRMGPKPLFGNLFAEKRRCEIALDNNGIIENEFNLVLSSGLPPIDFKKLRESA